jgi:hypothetical protein
VEAELNGMALGDAVALVNALPIMRSLPPACASAKRATRRS